MERVHHRGPRYRLAFQVSEYLKAQQALQAFLPESCRARLNQTVRSSLMMNLQRQSQLRQMRICRAAPDWCSDWDRRLTPTIGDIREIVRGNHEFPLPTLDGSNRSCVHMVHIFPIDRVPVYLAVAFQLSPPVTGLAPPTGAGLWWVLRKSGMSPSKAAW